MSQYKAFLLSVKSDLIEKLESQIGLLVGTPPPASPTSFLASTGTESSLLEVPYEVEKRQMTY